MLHNDAYLHRADFCSYLDAQARAGHEFLDAEGWARKAILTVARTGKLSRDRTIREYASEIWDLRPVP